MSYKDVLFSITACYIEFSYVHAIYCVLFPTCEVRFWYPTENVATKEMEFNCLPFTGVMLIRGMDIVYSICYVLDIKYGHVNRIRHNFNTLTHERLEMTNWFVMLTGGHQRFQEDSLLSTVSKHMVLHTPRGLCSCIVVEYIMFNPYI